MEDESPTGKRRMLRYRTDLTAEGRLREWSKGLDSRISQLKRRRVARVGVTYSIFFWLIVQVCDVLFPLLDVQERVMTVLVIAGTIGLLIAIALAYFVKCEPAKVEDDEIDSGYVTFIVSLTTLICIAGLASLILAQQFGS